MEPTVGGACLQCLLLSAPAAELRYSVCPNLSAARQVRLGALHIFSNWDIPAPKKLWLESASLPPGA